MLADWLKRLEGPAVLVTVVETKGSVPREAGARMLVEALGQQGSIGGGELEWRALKVARAALRAGLAKPELRSFALGPELGQCCGGHVKLLFEPLIDMVEIRALAETLDALDRPALLTRRLGDGTRGIVWDDGHSGHVDAEVFRAWLQEPGPRIEAIEEAQDAIVVERLASPRPHIWIFGAGHVGRALVDVLARLPRQRVIWVDERADIFPPELPPSVTKLWVRMPEVVVPQILGGAAVLVMTHSHARDLAIVDRALKRPELGFVGLIGSKTKRLRFERRLGAGGHERAALDRLVCPIGLPGIRGKEPELIALAVAAQLLEHYGNDPRYG